MAHAYEQSWETAWRTRDPAFDGRLFIGVRSTGVYCRCVCPVKLPLRRNIDFYPRAAAAEAAGFRPCPRCRPETAPYCPAWKGTLTTVERAARLISEEGALDNEGQSVDALAERLGVTPRHLRRLFVRHWGVPPTAVARTIRVQRAKWLLSETDLPMIKIALEAGFGSLRSFNAVFAEVSKCPPSEIRYPMTRRCPMTMLSARWSACRPTLCARSAIASAAITKRSGVRAGPSIWPAANPRPSRSRSRTDC